MQNGATQVQADIPDAPEGATAVQVRQWMEEQIGLTLASARALLKPHVGRKGAYREALGKLGEYALWLVSEASPETARETVGYATASMLSERWPDYNLPIVKRTTIEGSPWDAVESGYVADLSGDDLHKYYLKATGGVDKPLVHDPITVAGDFLELDLVADSHFGPRSMDYARWCAWTDRVRERPDLYWGHLGDWWGLGSIGAYTASDPEIVSYEQSRDDLIPRTLRGITDRNLFAVRGNHDARMARVLGIDVCPVRDLCKRLRLHYAGTERFVVVPVTDGERTETYTLYVHHGYGGGRSEGYGLRKAAELAHGNRADAVLIGHLHREETGSVGQRVVTQERELSAEFCRTITVPSFQRHITGTFSANIGVGPRPLGHRTICLHLDGHRITLLEE